MQQGMKNDFGGHDNFHFNNLYAYVGLSITPHMDISFRFGQESG